MLILHVSFFPHVHPSDLLGMLVVAVAILLIVVSQRRAR